MAVVELSSAVVVVVVRDALTSIASLTAAVMWSIDISRVSYTVVECILVVVPVHGG